VKIPGHSVVELDGIRVGTTETLFVPKGKEIRVNMRFRPYWPGMFHLMAIMADQKGDRPEIK
jgi:hypothetical protein